MRVKKNETNLRKRRLGRKALLLGLVLLLALSPVNWGGAFGGPADGESGAGERRAAAPADADSIWERVYADETVGAEGGSDGDGSAGDTASGPAITVVGVNVKNTDTLEVGIQVGGPDQPLFQSVGLVLEYDRSRLTPIDWQPGWQTVESQTTNASGEAITTSSTAVVAGQEDWKSLAVYTPTWINSGTAQVYEPGGGTGVGAAGKGYLLLQANTEYPYSLPTARQIVTVKFQYTGDSVGTGGAITPAASFADVGLALAGAEGSGLSEGKKVAYTSRVKHVGLYHTGKAFYYNGALRDDGSGNAEEDPTLSGRTLAVNFSASIVEGETQQAAGGGTGDVAVLSFYDWDETMLGSSIISKTAGEEEIKEALIAFSQSQYAVASGGDKPTEFPADLTNESYVDNAAFPLTYKKGYNFAGWVRADGKEGSEPLTEAFTAYETLGETPEADGSYPKGSFNAARWKYEAGPNGGSWGNIVLKAGYVENAWCNYRGEGVTEAQKSFYVISDFSYNRYGAAIVNLSNGTVTREGGNYSIKMTVNRLNGAGYGVTRLYEPVVRAAYTMNVGGTDMNMYAYVALNGSDQESAELIAPRNASNFTVTVVDAGQRLSNGDKIASYTLADSKSSSQTIQKSVFLPEATLNYFNDKAREHNEVLPNAISADWSNNVANPDFYDLGMYDSEIDQYYYQYGKASDLAGVTNAGQLRNMAKNKITLYMLGKGNRNLTVAEIKEAIAMQTGTANNNKVPAAISTNIRTAYNNVKAAYAANGSQELSADQIAYAINNNGALLP